MLFNRLITLAIFVYIIRQNEELWGTCIMDRRTNLQVTDGQIDIGQRETDIQTTVKNVIKWCFRCCVL